ncbi:MAG: acetate--CoA ligase family protein [Chloroflexota bacterium]
MVASDIRQLIAAAKKEGRSLTEIESKQVFRSAGLDVTETRLAVNEAMALEISQEIGYPVVLKIVSHDIVHKTEVGGVKLNLTNTTAVKQAFRSMMASARKLYPDAGIHGVAVQKMARPGTEVIIGMSRDPQFGPVLLFGLGGIFVEIMKDVAFGITPLTPRDAHDMLRQIKGFPLLDGFRGREKVDTATLEAWLLKLAEFSAEYPEIKEFDLNPILAYPDGATVVDARIILG